MEYVITERMGFGEMVARPSGVPVISESLSFSSGAATPRPSGHRTEETVSFDHDPSSSVIITPSFEEEVSLSGASIPMEPGESRFPPDDVVQLSGSSFFGPGESYSADDDISLSDGSLEPSMANLEVNGPTEEFSLSSGPASPPSLPHEFPTGLSLSSLFAKTPPSGRVSLLPLRGLYSGRVPLDIDVEGQVELVRAEFVSRGGWRKCSLDSASPSGSRARVWWNAPMDVYGRIATKVRVGGGLEPWSESGVFEVENLGPKAATARLDIDSWSIPASGNPPSGAIYPACVLGRSCRSVLIGLGKDIGARRLETLLDFESASMSGCVFTNGEVELLQDRFSGTAEMVVEFGDARDWIDARGIVSARGGATMLEARFSDSEDGLSSMGWVPVSDGNIARRGRFSSFRATLSRQTLSGKPAARGVVLASLSDKRDVSEEFPVLPWSWLLDDYSDWGSAMSTGMTRDAEPGKISKGDGWMRTGGVVDAGGDVEWGVFEADVLEGAGRSYSYFFRSSTSAEGWEALSSKPWVKPSGVQMEVPAGRWVEWLVEGTGFENVRTFLSSGTLVSPVDATVRALVVAGGGGGGMDMGGGGGGGGVLHEESLSLPAGLHPIVVGAGGTGAPAAGTNGQPGSHQYTIPAQKGGDSSFRSMNAIGGGYGGSSVYTHALGGTPGNGGSGGGASGYSNNNAVQAGGTGVSGQGYPGGQGGPAYYSGGGGGAGGPGVNSTSTPHGGPGALCSILGVDYYWGGGGGGSAYSASPGGNGGTGGGGGGAVGSTTGGSGLNNGSPGGGGNPGEQTNRPGGNAGPSTGGGGGGGSHYNANNKGGDGGSGIVVVRYADNSNGWSGGTLSRINLPVALNSLTLKTAADTPYAAEVSQDVRTGSILDAGRSVEWGIYRHSSSEATFKFRASNTPSGLASASWSTGSSGAMFSPPASGRLLEWRCELGDNGWLDRLALWAGNGRFFFDDSSSGVCDAGSDEQWSHLAAEDSGMVEYDYRFASDSEGEASLSLKPWTRMDRHKGLSSAFGRWLAWRSSGGASISSVMVALDGMDATPFIMEIVPSGVLGLSMVRTETLTDRHSVMNASRVDGGPLALVGPIDEVGVWPFFVWNDSQDAENDPLRYIFQLVPEEHVPSMNDVQEWVVDTDAGWQASESMDSGLTIASGRLLLASGTRCGKSAVYRFGGDSVKVWEAVEVVHDSVQARLAGTLVVETRTSNDCSSWTAWERKHFLSGVCARAKWMEVRLSFNMLSPSAGDISVSMLRVRALTGHGLHVIEGGTTGFGEPE